MNAAVSFGTTPSERLRQGLRRVHARATELDLARYVSPRSREALRATAAVELAAMVVEAIELLDGLEACFDAGGEQEIDELDWGDTFELTPLVTEQRAAPSRSMESSLSQHVADTCFTAKSELRRVQRGLAVTELPHDELLGNCERARRKLRRSIAVVDEAVSRVDGRVSQIVLEQDVEVEAAVAIRAMYAKFRRSLVACNEGDPESVRRAIRYAAVSLAVMVGSGDFSDVRLVDRKMLLALQQRVLDWARAGQAADGVRLYKDIQTAAELLRGINMRQELQAHDAALVAEIANDLEPPPRDSTQIERLLGRLRALRGRTDRLDDLLETALDGRLADVSAGIRAELEAIAAALPRAHPAPPEPGVVWPGTE